MGTILTYHYEQYIDVVNWDFILFFKSCVTLFFHSFNYLYFVKLT